MSNFHIHDQLMLCLIIGMEEPKHMQIQPKISHDSIE